MYRYIAIRCFTLFLLTCAAAPVFFGCTSNKTSETTQDTLANFPLWTRARLVLDLNGDGTQDTLFESYISTITGKETPMQLDSVDFDRNVELIISRKPATRLYCNIVGVDTFLVTDQEQQSGILVLEDLGDLDDQPGNEVGVIVRYEDYSNLNNYLILTLKGNSMRELFHFTINEDVSYMAENMIGEESLVARSGPGTIEYRFYSDSATVEKGTHSFIKP